MSESTQHKLSRVRPPRVQITYDVETGGAKGRREIPFVVGVLAPLAGKSDKVAERLSDRKMTSIDRDNFDKVMSSIEPKLQFSVPGLLDGDVGAKAVNTSAELTFRSFDDFEPVNVALQIPSLANLYYERARLRDFLAKLDGNDALLVLLEAVLSDKKRRDALNGILSLIHI